MDDPKRIVLDISSDEDVGWGESGVTTSEGGGGGGCGVRDDGDWLSEVLNEMNKTIVEPDEQMMMVAKSLVKCVENKEEEEDDDDDCVILDGDPEKPITVENNGGGEDSDELCVVSEKGQVACRDYPHSRHLCVKFPFSSTLHERHCDKCHCYVCDSVAPCVLWGNGAFSTDHCHATEKDEYWKAQRDAKKKSSTAQPLVSGVRSTPMLQPSPLPNNHLMHNQEVHGSQPCSITTVSRPNSMRPVRTQVSRSDSSNRFHSLLGSHDMRRRDVGHAYSRPISHNVLFKRAGVSGGVLTTNRYGNNSSGNHYNYQYSGNQSPGSIWQGTTGGGGGSMLSTYQGSNQADFGGFTAHLVPNSQPLSPINNELGNYAPSEPQISFQVPISSINANSMTVPYPQLFSANSMPTIHTVPTEQSWGSPYENIVPLQPQVALQPNMGRTRQNVMPSQPLVTSHGYINYPTSTPTIVPFQPNTSIPLQIPSSYQQQHFGQLHDVPVSADFSFNQVTQNNQTLPVTTQLQSTILREEPGIENNSQLFSSSYPNRVDSEFDSWPFEDDPASESLEFPMSSGLDVYYPECWSPL